MKFQLEVAQKFRYTSGSPWKYSEQSHLSAVVVISSTDTYIHTYALRVVYLCHLPTKRTLWPLNNEP